MKKLAIIFIMIALLAGMTGCSGSSDKGGEEAAEWSRVGTFQDGNENYLMIYESNYEEYPGWMITFMLSDGDIHGWIIQQEGSTLHGNLIPEYEEGEYIVTISEEGEDGVMLEVEGGETYHFTQMDVPEATISVTVNVEGVGHFTAVSDDESQLQIDDPRTTSAIFNLEKPVTYTMTAFTEQEGYAFVKWTKDGEDFSTEPEITVEFTESANYLAVFEYQE